MALSKQARVLSKSNIDLVLALLQTSSAPVRNKLIFLLSTKAGLRAKEISSLKWSMLLAPDGSIGEVIALEDVAAKGRSGRTIPIGKVLLEALVAYRAHSFGAFTVSNLADRYLISRP